MSSCSKARLFHQACLGLSLSSAAPWARHWILSEHFWRAMTSKQSREEQASGGSSHKSPHGGTVLQERAPPLLASILYTWDSGGFCGHERVALLADMPRG